MKRIFLYKLKASSLSFAVFLLFASLLAAITWHFWFPDYLFWLDGGAQGLKLVYAVDVVLGPLLVFIFFHPDKSKKKLVFDIVVVALVQLSAMVWGCYQVYKQRPVAVVYGNERFISVAPDIMALQSKSANDLRVYSSDNPPFVFRREPVNDTEKLKYLSLLMKGGFHPESQAWLFTPFHEHLDEVFQRQAGMQEFIKDMLLPEWQQWANGRLLKEYRFALFEGRYGNAVLIFDRSGVYQGYLSLGEMELPTIEKEALNQ